MSDVSVPVTIETPGATIHTPWGDSTVAPTATNCTAVLHIDDTTKAELQSILVPGAVPAVTLSAQDLANLYSSSELIAAYQLAVKAGK